MQREFGCETELVASGGGVFEVSLDDELVFSKRAEGRFPETPEIADALRARST
ncbi:MAG: SelT/SelW/SelH family protein [bacterium]|nr:SelT/SelW/SelH family protein [bacterium]